MQLVFVKRIIGLMLSLAAAQALGGTFVHDVGFNGPGPMAGWERHTGRVGTQGPMLDLYLRADTEPRPLLVLLPGSVCMPVYQYVQVGEQRGISASIPVLDAAVQARLGAHFALLERRGLRSLDPDALPLQAGAPPDFSRYPCDEVRGGATLEHRVADTLQQLEYLRADPRVDDILLVGLSEGADVAAAVAAELPAGELKGLLLLGGAGLSQFVDLLTLSRQRGDAEVQAQLDDFDAYVRGEYRGDYMGYPAERWSSFALRTSPREALLRSRAPLMVVHGTEDRSVPISSIDASVIELVRAQPERSIHYWSLPGTGHDLRTSDGRMLYPDLLEAFVLWAQEDVPGRRLRHGLPEFSANGNGG